MLSCVKLTAWMWGTNMKNRYYEMLRETAKRTRRNHRHMHDGVAVYHLYGGEYAKTRSYWDDTGFMLGSQWVGVNYTHPRYMYEEECSSLAYEHVKAHGESTYEDRKLFADSKPIYKKVGKSRKKVHLWEMGEIGNQEFYAEWDRYTHMFKHGVFHTQLPHFKVYQCAWGRRVDICIPEEILCEDDLVMLCDIVKACLADPNYFKFKYGNYAYTWREYVAEQEIDNAANQS